MADLAALLDDENFERATGRLRQLPEPDGAREAGRAGPDEQDVDFERIALRHIAYLRSMPADSSSSASRACTIAATCIATRVSHAAADGVSNVKTRRVPLRASASEYDNPPSASASRAASDATRPASRTQCASSSGPAKSKVVSSGSIGRPSAASPATTRRPRSPPPYS